MIRDKSHPPLVLASVSPRRRTLLERLGMHFTVDPSGVDESEIPYTSQREFAIKAALSKACDVAGRYENACVIGADTIVCPDGHILGKPGDRDEARRMLKRLRGRSHTVITGVAVAMAGSKTILVDAEETQVFFKRFRESTLERYLDSGEYLDKAGAYGIQGRGECLVHHIRGDYFNVVGLPVKCLLRLLSHVMDVESYLERLRTLERPF